MSIHEEPKPIGPAIDGIEEYNNPLPRWWLYMFYSSIVFAIGYQFAYPSWFGPGFLQWSEYKDYDQEIADAKVLYPAKVIDINNFINKAQFIEAGKSIFAQNCASCHGAEAKGLIGPNLTDNTWINGSKPENIYNTITTGVKAKGMPTWGPVLGAEKVATVAAFVYSLSHDLSGNVTKEALAQSAAAPATTKVAEVKALNMADFIGKPAHVTKGKDIFAQNCASCHGPEGKGLVGPNLTDNVWIHGGKPENIQNTVTKGVAGKAMPVWGPILGAEKIADVSAFVYSLSHK